MMAAGTSRVAETRNKRSYGDGLLWTDAEGAAGMQVCIAQLCLSAYGMTTFVGKGSFLLES